MYRFFFFFFTKIQKWMQICLSGAFNLNEMCLSQSATLWPSWFLLLPFIISYVCLTSVHTLWQT